MSLYAAFICCVAVACWGLGAMFDKLAVGLMPPRAVFISRLYLMFIILLAPMVAGWDSSRAAVLKAGTPVILWLAGSVVFTVGGLFAYYHALTAAEASKVVPFCAAYPLVAYALAVVFLREPFTASSLLGAALVVAGAALLALGGR